MPISNESVTSIVQQVVSAGRSRLADATADIISAGTTLIVNNDLPSRLLDTRSVSMADFGSAYGFVYSFPPFMATLREPGNRKMTRLIPTKSGNKSASARLVYRIAYGVISQVIGRMADEYNEKLIQEIEKDFTDYGKLR